MTAAPRSGGLRAALGVAAVAWGLLIASLPLDDNSFLTHLATGRLILDRGSVPTADPYSFTAAGEPWVVQSWLASILYAVAEQVGGAAGLRVLAVVVFGTGALLLLRLAGAATTLLPAVGIVFGALGVAAATWTFRPFMAGVLGTGALLLLLLAEGRGRARPWLAAPLVWLWAGAHGSFPFGLVLVVLVALGVRLDGGNPRHEGRVLGWAAAGALAAVVSPLGPKVLVFPLTALSKADVLRFVHEWQAPDFGSTGERLFLALALAALAGLVRRPSWRWALPVLAFVALSLLARRNIPLALPVLVPAMAATLGDMGTLHLDRPSPLTRPFAVAAAGLLLVAGFAVATRPVTSLEDYPTRALAWVRAAALPDGARTATQDFTGNLLGLLDGPTGEVFVDDRVDMFPPHVVEDYRTLLGGRPGWAEVLGRHGIDLVVWEREEPLAAILAADPGWRVVFADEDWQVACRRGRCPA